MNFNQSEVIEMNNNGRNKMIKNITVSTVLVMLFFTMISCERQNSVARKDMKTNFPNRSLIDANIIFKDSGRVTMNLRSPLIEEYSLIDTPYTIFKKGVEVDFYENGSDKPGKFKADWGILSDKTGLYEGRGNVIVVTENGDSIKSEQLFWNKNKKQIYTTKLVELTGKDGSKITAKNGIQATDDLEEYILFNNDGYIMMKEEQKF